MGQFKPMVKMMTTEPTVELKLKKGGSATHTRMHKEGAKEGFKPVKKMNGGVMSALSRTPTPTTPMGNPEAIRAMASKRMPSSGMGTSVQRPPVLRKPSVPLPGPTQRVTGTGSPGVRPSVPLPGQTKMMGGMGAASAPAMKKGGSTADKLKKHAAMPASEAHKGLKTGGIAKSTKPGGYKTGGVVNGQGGYKAGGIIKTMTGKTTKVVEAKPDHNSAPTGDVKMGNAGGYKKGGAAKKHFATGGRVVNDSGHAVAMPKKAPSKPVAISELSGTFKKGGRVC